MSLFQNSMVCLDFGMLVLDGVWGVLLFWCGDLLRECFGGLSYPPVRFRFMPCLVEENSLMTSILHMTNKLTVGLVSAWVSWHTVTVSHHTFSVSIFFSHWSGTSPLRNSYCYVENTCAMHSKWFSATKCCIVTWLSLELSPTTSTLPRPSSSSW